MTQLQIQVIGQEKLQRALRDPRIISGPLNRFLERASQTVEADAKSNAPVDTGRLRSSISRRIELGQQRALVGSKLPYARAVEFGRPPGRWPPMSALQPWARRHGFPAGRQGAFLVARKIAFKGIRPRPYLVPALENNRRSIGGFLNQMANDIEREFGRRVR